LLFRNQTSIICVTYSKLNFFIFISVSKKLSVSGWGVTKPKHYPKYLHRVSIPVITRHACTKVWREQFPTWNAKKQHICAGTGKKGACIVSKRFIIKLVLNLIMNQTTYSTYTSLFFAIIISLLFQYHCVLRHSIILLHIDQC
jgi:hypothetical protein